MMEERQGIAAAGNWILDITKMIDVFPAQDTLANISSKSTNNGGAPYNILKDLARLKAPFPLSAIGLVGQDEAGQFIIEDCKSHQIDTSQLAALPDVGTSYTDVMLVKDTGRRTFFHYRGANALLDTGNIDFKLLKSKIFHLGYLLLLDKLDEFEDAKRTKASLLLENAKIAGFKTTIDIVSENSNRFKKVVLPSLPFVDVLFLNEYEASKITNVDLPPQKLNQKNIRKAIKKLLDYGVNEWVVLHFPEGCVAGNRNSELIVQGSINLPGEKIIASTGAGDAFAAGVLFGIHEGWLMEKCLKSGVCTAALSLTKSGCSDGIRESEHTFNIGNQYGFRNLKIGFQ